MALNDLLSQVDKLKSEIDKLRPIKPIEERRILDKFRLDWNYHSNAIEGNQLTLGETRVLLLEGLTAQGKPLKDSLDIKGHDAAITFLENFVRKNEDLSEAAIREFHKVLLHEPYQVEARTPDGQTTKKWVKLGEYKTEPNFAQSSTGAPRHFTLPQDVPAKMHELIEWFKNEKENKTLHPIIIAAIFHHRFVRIHPFDDGNGRMARILMNLIIMQNGFQPVIIKTQNKEQYIAALIKADAGEQNEFIELIVGEEIHSEELFLKGAKGEDISDFDDIDKKIALLKQELSNVPEPVELDGAIQLDFIKKCLEPCFNRLNKKLSQFDELYGQNQFSPAFRIWTDNQRTNQTTWNPHPSLTKEDAFKRIEHVINEQMLVFSLLQFSFSWTAFKKAGLNTFSNQCGLSFAFLRHQYRITATHEGSQVFSHSDVYQNLFSEEQANKLVNNLAEACLKHITSKMNPKK